MQSDEKLSQLESKIAELEASNKANIEATSMLFQSRFSSAEAEDEIDLVQLFSVIWKGKFKIIFVAFIFSLASVFYALSLPNVYTSTLKLVPTNQESDNGLSSLASKYGGLASMAGINLGGGSNGSSIEHAIELMNSWPYIESFVEKHNLKTTFMAVSGWNPNGNKLLYNKDIFDAKDSKWLSEKKWFSDEVVTLEPTSFKTYEKIRKEFLKVNFDDEIGVFTIAVSHYSPEVAYEIVNKLKDDINDYFRQEDKKEALASIEFLENKIGNTANSQMREVFYNMIESHTQKIMMTEINEEYLVKTLIPAKVSEPKEKSKPKRGFIVLGSTVLGGILGALWVVISGFRSSNAFKEQ